MAKSDAKVLILDFDGTLADIIPMIKKIAQDNGQIELTDELLDKLRRGTVKDAMREVNIKTWQLPAILNRARKIIYKERENLKLFPGITELMKYLQKAGWEMYILSTNRSDTINSVMTKYGLQDHAQILKRPSLFGKSARIKSLIKRNGYNPKKIWIVGDETRDLVAGKKAGINVIAVSWGLQHEEVLSRYEPDYLVNSVSDLKKILSEVG